MLRRSSSSASTPSRIMPPSRATAGGSSMQRARRARRGCRRDRRARRAGCGRAAPATRSSSSRTRGIGGDRLPQRHQIARSRGPERRARDEPLDVVDRLQRLAHLRPLGAAERELLDRVEPILNPLERDQRPQQPGAQQPAAHRRHRAIDLVEQRTGASAVAASITSRFRSVVGSTTRQSAPVRKAISRTCARSAFCVSRRYCTSAPAAQIAGRVIVEPEAVQAVRRAAVRAAPARAASNSNVQSSALRDERAEAQLVDERAGRPANRRARRFRAAAAPRARRQAPGAPSAPSIRRS